MLQPTLNAKTDEIFLRIEKSLSKHRLEREIHGSYLRLDRRFDNVRNLGLEVVVNKSWQLYSLATYLTYFDSELIELAYLDSKFRLTKDTSAKDNLVDAIDSDEGIELIPLLCNQIYDIGRTNRKSVKSRPIYWVSRFTLSWYLARRITKEVDPVLQEILPFANDRKLLYNFLQQANNLERFCGRNDLERQARAKCAFMIHFGNPRSEILTMLDDYMDKIRIQFANELQYAPDLSPYKDAVDNYLSHK